MPRDPLPKKLLKPIADVTYSLYIEKPNLIGVFMPKNIGAKLEINCMNSNISELVALVKIFRMDINAFLLSAYV